MEAEAERQSELKRVLGAVGLDAAAVIEEILHTGLKVDAEIGRDIILRTETKRYGPLYRNMGRLLFLECIRSIIEMANIDVAVYRQLKHGSRRGVEAETGFVIPCPSES